jgi:iron complex transport system substrate-binding protein
MKPIILFLFLLTFIGCTEKKASNSQTFQTKTDGLGRKVVFTATPKRVMALSPALTEMLFKLLPDSEIIGVSQVCNFPLDKVKSKPIVNTYPLDYEKLLSLKPDLVFAEEGIVSFETAAQLERLHIPCYFFAYKKVEDVWSAMDTIGIITQHTNILLTDSLRFLQSQFGNKEYANRPKVLCLISTKPIYVWGANTIMTEKLLLAGGTNAMVESFSKPYPELTRVFVLNLNPDVIFGCTMKQLDSSFFSLYPELKLINAYKNKQCYSLDDDLNTRPGPRTLENITEMKKYLHP